MFRLRRIPELADRDIKLDCSLPLVLVTELGFSVGSTNEFGLHFFIPLFRLVLGLVDRCKYNGSAIPVNEVVLLIAPVPLLLISLQLYPDGCLRIEWFLVGLS